MSKLTIQIATDNDACQEAHDVAMIVSGIAGRISAGESRGSVKDYNGNTVGSFRWQGKP